MLPCHSGTIENLVGPSTAICHSSGTVGHKESFHFPSTLLYCPFHLQVYSESFSNSSAMTVDSQTLGVLPPSQRLPGKQSKSFHWNAIPRSVWSFCCGTFLLVHPRKGSFSSRKRFRPFSSRTCQHLSSLLFSSLPLFSRLVEGSVEHFSLEDEAQQHGFGKLLCYFSLLLPHLPHFAYFSQNIKN